MEFIKKNYEKVLLGVVLLILTVAACLLPFIISAKRTALLELSERNQPKAKEMAPLDPAIEEAALQREQAPLKLDFTTKHNIFNPVVWKRLPDGSLRKEASGNEEGVAALEVTAIKPLYFGLTYVSPSASGYFIEIERETALRADKRKTQNFVSKGTAGELVSLHDVEGPADAPTKLVLEWKETQELINIAPNKPFRRVDGYAADLKYPLEANKTWTDRRVGSQPLVFANDSYNIVAITESNVVVLAKSNKKKTTIPFHPATETR